MSKFLASAVVVATLCGCASSAPTLIGDHTYFSAKTNTGGAFGNPTALAGSLMADGNKLCASQGREFQLVTQNVQPARYGNSLGGASITFKCVVHAGDVMMRPDNGVTTVENR